MNLLPPMNIKPFNDMQEKIVSTYNHIADASQQTFQSCFDVVFWLMPRRDAAQRQINVETTLCISTLESKTSIKVESTMCISTLTRTTLGNVKTTLPFSTSCFTTLANVETTL